MSRPDAVSGQSTGAESRLRLSATSAWRWSGALLVVGVGLGMVAEGADPVPFYTVTSARVDVDAELAAPGSWNPPEAWDAPSGASAVAVVHATRASLAKGSLRLEAVSGGSTLRMSVEGLVPGIHEVRVHTSGDCSDEGRESFGVPYAFDRQDVTGQPGVIATLEVGSDWMGRSTVNVPGLSLNGETSVVGRALVIHLVEPAGTGTDARPGTIMACGTVGVV